MESIRYYYGARYKVAQVPMLLDENNEFCGVCGDFKPISNTPRVTICSIYNNETNEVAFGVARCSHRDQFVKSVGRDLSYYRANESPYKVVKIGENRVSDVFMTNAMDIESEVESQSAPITVAKSNFTPVEGVPIF